MYRTAAKRVFLVTRRFHNNSNVRFQFPPPQAFIGSSRLSTSQSQPFCNEQPPLNQGPNFPDSSSSSSSSTSSSSTWSASSTAEDARHHETPRHRAQYQDEQARVLSASLPHVIKLGWTEAALIAGTREVDLSPSIIGSFPRKEAALVEFFMDDCLQRLIDRIDSDEGLKNMSPSDCLSKLIRIRLEMQAPFISKWPQALSIQAQPINVPTSFKQRAMLIDEICHAAGDNASDIDWYVKRTVLGGIYSTTEIYMLTDSTPEFRDTWAFLDARVKDAFDLKKTIQEAQYLAEAIGAGMGGSLDGFVRKVFNR
ncbi:hypothetical protein L6164_013856 [Bauhinia variegata]|uniref:Uncharacterized protein n=1 Tax=Bauhinia variegata TaxID=167791 RepID=A0ACB9NGR9_BAUVA|nr:hypothetical protein L6164_013856 [Bauhinia variegata]